MSASTWRPRVPVGWKVGLALGAALAIQLAIGTASLRSTAATVADSKLVAHTQEVLTTLEATVSDLVDLQTGARGYIITGDTVFLTPYARGLRDLQPHLGALRELTADNALQQQRLTRLDSLADHARSIFADDIRVRRQAGFAAARGIVLTRAGKSTMEAAHELTVEMAAEERTLLAHRTARAASAARQARVTTWLGALAGVLVAAGAGWTITRDLAGRRRAEAQLSASEERYRLLFDGNPIPVWVFDVATLRFLTVNDAATRAYGYTRDEFLALTIADIRPPEEIPRLVEAIAQITPQRHGGGIWRHRRKDGSTFDVEVTSHPLTYEGRLAELVLARDVSARLQAEEALRASEERFRSLAVTANDAIISADVAGLITYFNPAAERIFGVPATQVAGQPLTVLMPERFWAAHRAGLDRYLRTRVPRVVGRTVELVGRRHDGTEFRLELSLAGWQRGDDVAFTAIIRDVTERKRTEAALRESEAHLERQVAELGAVNRELEAFSYSISHDLRAPLRAIDGFARILVEDHGAQLDADAHRLLDVVRNNAGRMGRLIDDLLQFARVGRQVAHPVAIDMTDLVRAVVADLHAAAPAAVISVGSLPPALGDPALLRQVWVNLIGNALKYSAKRARPTVEIGATNGTETSDEVGYYVRDNGVGFDMQYAGKLFRVFERLHRAAEFDGTGVGLAIVQRIVHRHGGRAWATSEPDKGATFYFTLPETGA